MGLARGRGRGRGRGTILKLKNRGPVVKPPPLMGRPAPPPGMVMRPRGLPVPPLLPRLRPPPPPGIRSPRLLPHSPPLLGPVRPPIPPPYPPHPPPHGLPLPPPIPPRPPLPPPSLLRSRVDRLPPPHVPMNVPRGFRPSLPPPIIPPGPRPMRGKFGNAKRGGANVQQRGMKRKPKEKKSESPEDSEINKPWVTEAMKNEIQKKHRLYQKAKKSNAQADWDEFKEQRNRVAVMIKEAKLEYIGSHPEEDGSYYCETCDRAFSSSWELDEHLSEHETCGLDGCQFTAHPKVVTRHVQMQHATGLFHKINSKNTPEDISKWISERKRNYPSKENIEKRAQEQLEKLKRGEKLGPEKSRFNRDFQFQSKRKERFESFKNVRGRGGVRGRQNRGGHMAKEWEPKETYRKKLNQHKNFTAPSTNMETENWRDKLPMFPGTASFRLDPEPEVIKDEEEIFSDLEWELSSEPQLMEKQTKPITCVSSVLRSLMDTYASESEDEISDVKFNDLPVKEKSVSTIADKSPVHRDFENKEKVNIDTDEDSGPEEVPVTKVVEPALIVSEQELKYQALPNQPAEKELEINSANETIRKSRKRHRTHKNRSVEQVNDTMDLKTSGKVESSSRNLTRKRRRFTFLEKLLTQEIRHERNIILQCIRHIVKNNFFSTPLQKHTPKESITCETELGETIQLSKREKQVLQCIHFIVQKKFFNETKENCEIILPSIN